MKFFSLLFVAALCSVASFARINERKGVLILTDNNFKEAIQKYLNIFVVMGAPWCGYCTDMDEDLEQAARKLKKIDRNVKIAKINCSVEKRVCSAHKLKVYPTMKFYRNGTAIDYDGRRDYRAIVGWVYRNAFSP